MATTSYISLANELREIRNSARRKYGDGKPILYEVEIKDSNSPDLALFDSMTAVFHHVHKQETEDKTLHVKVQVFVVETDNSSVVKESFRYVGKVEFYGGKRRMMYKKMQGELQIESNA